jgi:hypothetical protein
MTILDRAPRWARPRFSVATAAAARAQSQSAATCCNSPRSRLRRDLLLGRFPPSAPPGQEDRCLFVPASRQPVRPELGGSGLVGVYLYVHKSPARPDDLD